VNGVATIFVFLAPVGLVYGWAFYWVRLKTEPGTWRRHVTLASLVWTSVAILLWPICKCSCHGQTSKEGLESVIRFKGWTLGRGVPFVSC
jgi:hypothetical protein